MLLYGIRVFYFGMDDDLFAVYKIAAVFLINLLSVQFVDSYLSFLKEKDDLLKTEQAEKEVLKLKNKVLKEQVNPHFLFNSLNVLASLIYLDQSKANEYTKITSFQAIESSSKYFHSRLKLTLKPHFEQEVLVSRVRVKEFLDWLDS